MQGGGQVKTEQRKLVNAWTLQKQAPSSFTATVASPDLHGLTETRGQDHMGSRHLGHGLREPWEWGHTGADTVHTGLSSLPAHPRAQATPAPHLPSRRWWASSAAGPTG